MNENIKAFLSMIATSEGVISKGDDGYNVDVGGNLFHDYSKHPNIRVWIARINDWSTAAGRYQILYRFWLVYCNQLNLYDKKLYSDGAFGKAAQDAIAVQMIKECEAYIDVVNGNFEIALKKCMSRWASLPGASQHTSTTVEGLKTAYIDAGGKLA